MRPDGTSIFGDMCGVGSAAQLVVFDAIFTCDSADSRCLSAHVAVARLRFFRRPRKVCLQIDRSRLDRRRGRLWVGLLLLADRQRTAGSSWTDFHARHDEQPRDRDGAVTQRELVGTGRGAGELGRSPRFGANPALP